MSEVTRILSAIEQGDPHGAADLLPLVYGELRKLAGQKLAQEKPGQTLQATALVHEAYLRLVGTEKVQQWNMLFAKDVTRLLLQDSDQGRAGPLTSVTNAVEPLVLGGWVINCRTRKSRHLAEFSAPGEASHGEPFR
jgi:hypothetical protein